MSKLNPTDVTSSRIFQDRRRSEPRIACERMIALLPCGGDEHFLNVRLTDCSNNGLGMLIPQQLQAGGQVLMRLEVDRQPTLLMYTVRYCIPVTEHQFRTGARFSGFVANKFRGEMKSVID